MSHVALRRTESPVTGASPLSLRSARAPPGQAATSGEARCTESSMRPARGATGDRLRSIARSLLLELDRPARGGDPTELPTLLTTVECVRASDLWRRAGRASRRLSEVPFALALEGQADPPMWLEGVVDLAFREPAGWVLVDYKTDRGDDPRFATRRLAYHEQLRRYGDAWERLTGEPVVDRLILWTREGREERVEPSATPRAIP